MYLALVEIHHLHVSWTHPFLHSPPLWVPAPSACRPHKAEAPRASFIICICLPSNTFADHHTETTGISWTLWWTWQCACVDFLCGIFTAILWLLYLQSRWESGGALLFNLPRYLVSKWRVPESAVSHTTLLHCLCRLLWWLCVPSEKCWSLWSPKHTPSCRLSSLSALL